jgi:hypothetical protein
MHKTSVSLKFVIWTGLLALLLPLAAWAQSGQTVLINEIKPPEVVQAAGGVQGLSLDVTFTLLDSNEQVLATKIDPASIQISNGSYPALVQQLGTPWTVVVLIDASKTVANFQAQAAFKTAKTALADSLGGQQNITFSILKFDDTAPEQLGFSTDQEKIKKTITGIKAKQSGNSCMNNGVYEAINKLSGAPGRRAVILFSASQDNCSQRTPQDVVALAKQNHVQLYAVGLKGYGITREQLDALVKETGGLASVQEEGELSFAFRNVMSILANQWQAKATLFPPSGQQDAILQLTLPDATVITSGPVPFTSPQDFIPPPQISLKGVVQPKTDGLVFNLDIVSKEKIKELRLDITSKTTGLSVYSQVLSEFGETNPILVGNLETGEEYTLSIVAVDNKGVLLSQTAQEFKYIPPQVAVNITNFDLPTLEKSQITVTVDPAAPEGVVKFEVFVAKENDQTPLGGTLTTVPVNDPIVIPVTDALEAGEYQIALHAIDSTGKVVAEARSAKFTYQPFTWLDRLVASLKSNPIALAGIGGVCCFAVFALLVVVWVIVPKGNAQVKEVDIFVPEKRRQVAPSTSSGVFDREGGRVEPAPPPPPPRRQSDAPPPRRERAPEPPPAPPPQPVVNFPPAVLSAQTPPTALLRTPIRKVPCSIGRRDSNDMVVKVDSSLGVSGQHCTISFNNGQFFIQDDGSSYGTVLNGQVIPKGKPVPLPDGAQIGLGPKVVIVFRLGN